LFDSVSNQVVKAGKHGSTKSIASPPKPKPKPTTTTTTTTKGLFDDVGGLFGDEESNGFDDLFGMPSSSLSSSRPTGGDSNKDGKDKNIAMGRTEAGSMFCLIH
jgi:hypothetical protein